MSKVLIQGGKGSFHDECCQQYFDGKVEIVPSNSFEELCHKLRTQKDIPIALMAIENSIAGSILQNYRLLQENNFYIIGESYLRIRMNLMALANQSIEEIKEVHTHPMALYQCRKYLRKYPSLKQTESNDTALSAMEIRDNKIGKRATIASRRAAEIYGLQILAEGIEDNDQNYTRFFVLGKTKEEQTDTNKATAYFRIPHQSGSLLKVLTLFNELNINLSKLQSFPIMGSFKEYLFHVDLEFDTQNQFQSLEREIYKYTSEYRLLGSYKRALVNSHSKNHVV